MTMQSYPINNITPESSDEEKQRALQETMQQLVAEGVPQEAAQSQAMRMLQQIMQTPSFPQTDVTNYGDSMKPPANNYMRTRSSGSSKSIAPFRNQQDDQGFPGFKHGFNFDGRVSNK